MERRSFTKGLAALPLMLAPMLAGAAGRSAQAQARWAPDKPIRIVVPFAAGGSTDVTARLVGQALAERLGQTVVVDNRAGAGGNIGAEAVARAEPDGYTLLLATSSTNATNAALYKRLAFNPVRDFTPISQIAFVPNLLVVNPDAAGEQRRRAGGLCEGEAGPVELRLGRRRHFPASGRRRFRLPGRHRHGARALSRRRAGRGRPRLRQAAAELQPDGRGAPAGEGGQAARARRHHRAALGAAAGHTGHRAR